MAGNGNGKKGVFQGILSLFPGMGGENEPEKPDKDREMELIISKHQMKALENAFEGRMAQFERRMQALEGEYGAIIGAYKAKNEELETALEEKEEAVQQATDREAQIRALREKIPVVLDQLGYDEKGKQTAAAALMDARAKETLDALIEQYFPEMPITTEGLIALAPVIMGLMSKIGIEPAKKAAPGQQTNLGGQTTF